MRLLRTAVNEVRWLRHAMTCGGYEGPKACTWVQRGNAWRGSRCGYLVYRAMSS